MRRHPRSSCRLLRRLRRPQLPLRSPRGGVGNIRGRKVPPRRAAVLLNRHHPHSVSVLCGHPAALRSSAAGSLSLRKPGSRQGRQPRLLRSAPRYGFAVVKPACYSSRPFRRSTCARSSLLPSLTLRQSSGPCSFRDGKAFRAGRTQPSRPLAQTVSVIAALFSGIRLRSESALPATDCAGSRPASASWTNTSIHRAVPVRVHPGTPLERLYRAHSFGPFRPRPVRPSAHPHCRSLSGPGSLRSPSPCAANARQPTHTRPPPRPHSAALRVLWHCQTLSRHPQCPHTQSRLLRDWTAP